MPRAAVLACGGVMLTLIIAVLTACWLASLARQVLSYRRSG